MPKKSMPVGEKAAWIGAGAAIIVALIGVSIHMDNRPQTIMSSNGVAISQSPATSGNNSPIIQAATGATVQSTINNGVSDATLQKVVNLKEVELSERILAEYPHGCLILGLENGKVKYDSRLKGIQFDADWDNTAITVNNGNVDLVIPQLTVVSGGFHLNVGIAEQVFPLIEHKPVRTQWFNANGLTLYCEVLDKDRGIFIIGCK